MLYEIKVKIFRWEDHGPYLVIVARGEINKESVREIFRRVDEATLDHAGCKILFDLHEVASVASNADFDDVAVEAAQHSKQNKIVFVCPSDHRQHSELIPLRMCFVRRGYLTAVFADPKIATDWLTESP
jgi:hypothetical protein